MGMRSIANVKIGFGLVQIPVKIYLAAASENIQFNLISPAGNRVKQALKDATTGEEVEREQCKKGYPIGDNHYLVFDDEDLESVKHGNVGIEITAFTDASNNFTPIQVEKSYFLVPDKGGEKQYLLLARSLVALDRIAVGKWYVAGRDHMIAIFPLGNHLVMFQLFYPNELRSINYQFSSEAMPSQEEVEMAEMLVQKMTPQIFEFGKYRDEFAVRLQTIINNRQLTSAITPGQEPPGDTGQSLVNLLKTSLDRV